MKKYLKYVLAIFVFSLPMVSLALDFRGGDNPSISKTEKITDDAYMAGGSLTSAGDLKGDLVGAGGNIVVSGKVDGDLLLAGGNVTVLSDVLDDVRVGGGTIVLEGGIAGDLIAVGGQINTSGAGVGGDTILAGGNVRLDAPVAGDLKVIAESVYINTAVAGNVKIEAERITLGSLAVISGDLTYKSKKELTKEDGAVVKGEIDFELKPAKNYSKGMAVAFFSGFVLWKFFALLASSLMVGLIFHRYSNEVVKIATTRPVYEVGRGLLALAAMPVISIFLFMTLVGIPFGVLGLLGFVIVMIFAWMVTPIIVGSVVYSYFSKKEMEVSWLTILIGVFALNILGIIPFVGWLTQKILMLLTVGAMMNLKLSIVKDWR